MISDVIRWNNRIKIEEEQDIPITNKEWNNMGDLEFITRCSKWEKWITLEKNSRRYSKDNITWNMQSMAKNIKNWEEYKRNRINDENNMGEKKEEYWRETI